MKHSNFVDRESRRNALKGLAVLSGAAVATAAGTSASAGTVPSETKADVPKKLGYRETDHVREYYRCARF